MTCYPAIIQYRLLESDKCEDLTVDVTIVVTMNFSHLRTALNAFLLDFGFRTTPTGIVILYPIDRRSLTILSPVKHSSNEMVRSWPEFYHATGGL